jgi:hypothetical protein
VYGSKALAQCGIEVVTCCIAVSVCRRGMAYQSGMALSTSPQLVMWETRGTYKSGRIQKKWYESRDNLLFLSSPNFQNILFITYEIIQP